MVGGAGHVGVPLVLSFAATGLTVNVNDINADKLATLKAGRLPFIEHGAQALLTQALADKRLFFTSKPSEISTKGPVIVTIGTPVDEFLNPERRVIQNCIDGFLPHLRDGQLLVLRSTLYPGTTDWVEAISSSRAASSRSRSVPSASRRATASTSCARCRRSSAAPRPRPRRRRRRCSAPIVPEIVMLKPIEAEFAKLFNNAYRYIEFAITNQFYLIAKSAGLDYTRSCSAMKHNYPRAQEHPDAGLRRRALPGQGHDAAPRLRAQRVRARQCRDHGQRGPGAARRSATCGGVTISAT